MFAELTRRFDELTHALSERQRRVVAATLEAFVAAAPYEAAPAQRALERYWRAFT
jgi:hypothetical protein